MQPQPLLHHLCLHIKVLNTYYNNKYYNYSSDWFKTDIYTLWYKVSLTLNYQDMLFGIGIATIVKYFIEGKTNFQVRPSLYCIQSSFKKWL